MLRSEEELAVFMAMKECVRVVLFQADHDLNTAEMTSVVKVFDDAVQAFKQEVFDRGWEQGYDEIKTTLKEERDRAYDLGYRDALAVD